MKLDLHTAKNYQSGTKLAIKVAVLALSLNSLIMQPALAAGSSWQGYESAARLAQDKGKFADAENLYRQAVGTAEKSSASNADISRCLNELAQVLCDRDKSNEAVMDYKRSIGLLESAYGSQSKEIVPTLLALGSIYESEGNHDAAMVLYNRVLKIDQSNFGPYHIETGKTLHRMARLQHDSGKHAEAEGLYKRALEALDKSGSDTTAPADLQSCLQDYSRLLKELGKADEAQQLDERARALRVASHQAAQSAAGAEDIQSSWQKQVGALGNQRLDNQNNEVENILARSAVSQSALTNTDNAKLKPMYNTLADVASTQGRYLESEPVYKNIIAIDEKSLGKNDPALAADQNNLAMLYLAQKRYQEAEPLLKRSLSIYENSYGADNLLVIRTKTMLASVYEQENKFDQANSLYKGALDLNLQTYGPNNLETTKALNNLAFSYFRQGKLDDASTLYKWSLASAESVLGANDPLVASCLQDYAKVLRKQNRLNEAEQMEAKAQAILSAAH